MNLYFVRTKDQRTYVEPVLDYGEGPTFECWPMAIHAAESYGQAKSDFLWKQKQRLHSGVYSDDYPNLRCALLDHDVPYPRGELTSSYGWDQYSDLIELAMKQGFWSPEPCCVCGKWVGKNGTYHIESFEGGDPASMDATCSRCG